MDMMFAKSVRTLFAKTFITREKNEKMYNYCRKEEHKNYINTYLNPLGYYIEVYSKLGVIQLKNTTEMENEIGCRNDSLYVFSQLEQLYIMLFRQWYDEHPYENPVEISRKDFMEQVLSFFPNEKKTTYSESLRKLRYFNLISYSEGHRTTDDFNIQILPSIQFAIDEKQLEIVISNAKLSVDTDTETLEENESEEE